MRAKEISLEELRTMFAQYIQNREKIRSKHHEECRQERVMILERNLRGGIVLIIMKTFTNHILEINRSLDTKLFQENKGSFLW